MAENEKMSKPTKPSRKSCCNCTNFLYMVALFGAILAGVCYYIAYGCDLKNEHEEMSCAIKFGLRISPILFSWRVAFINFMAKWGVVDFHESMRTYLDQRDINTTLLFKTPNITQVPIMTQEWEHNGYKLYSYTPNEFVGVSNQPVLIQLHGGGGISLSPRFFDSTIRFLANKFKVKIIVPDYPKSPNVVYPTGHDTCLNAVKYVFENSEMFSVDRKRVSLSGDSFGGHALLYVAFKWRELGYDKKYAPLLTLTMVYPWVQLFTTNLESYGHTINYRFISPHTVAVSSSFLIEGHVHLVDLIMNSSLPLMSQYYQERQKSFPELLPKLDWEPPLSMVKKYSRFADTMLDPYTCFLFQTDFTHLPPTFIMNAEYDVLLSEGLMLKQRMEESGVQVEHYLVEKMVHGFFSLTDILFSPSLVGFDKLDQFLKKHINSVNTD